MAGLDFNVSYHHGAPLWYLLEDMGIDFPGMRDAALMSEEVPIDEAAFNDCLRYLLSEARENAFRSEPFGSMNPYCTSFCSKTDSLVKKYLEPVENKDWQEGNGPVYEVRWNLIHGKLRKSLKYLVKKYEREATERLTANATLWNQYAGRADVLRVWTRVRHMFDDSGDYENLIRYLDAEPRVLGYAPYWKIEGYLDVYIQLDHEVVLPADEECIEGTIDGWRFQLTRLKEISDRFGLDHGRIVKLDLEHTEEGETCPTTYMIWYYGSSGNEVPDAAAQVYKKILQQYN